jgi:hypothetical protein
MKKLVLLLLAVALLLPLAGCGEKKEYYSHEAVTMNVGESRSLALTSIPEGLTAGDYSWPTGAAYVLSVDENGAVTAVMPGEQTVYAYATYRNTTYYESFPITVPSDVTALMMSYPELNLLIGDTFMWLTAKPDGTFGPDDRVVWTCSDEAERTIEMKNVVSDFNSQVTVHAWNQTGSADLSYPATAIITAQMGKWSAECRVTVYDRNSPDQLLDYINAGGLNGFYTMEDNAVTLNGPYSSLDMMDGDAAVRSRFGTEPAGKYAVLLTYREAGAPLGLGFMALLPPEYLPARYEQVEYILRARSGEPIHVCDYGGGVKGLEPTVEIVLEDAVTGEVLTVYETLYGANDFPQKVIVTEGVTEYFSANPSQDEVGDALIRAIGALWSERCDTVTITDD